jgi:hypothetical protein
MRLIYKHGILPYASLLAKDCLYNAEFICSEIPLLQLLHRGFSVFCVGVTDF